MSGLERLLELLKGKPHPMFGMGEEYRHYADEQKRREQAMMLQRQDSMDAGINDFKQKWQQFMQRFQQPSQFQGMGINSQVPQQPAGQLRQPTPWDTTGYRG